MSAPDFIPQVNFFSEPHGKIISFLSHFFIPIFPGDSFQSIFAHNVLLNYSFGIGLGIITVVWLVFWWANLGYPTKAFSLVGSYLTMGGLYAFIVLTQIALNFGANAFCAGYLLPPNEQYVYVGRDTIIRDLGFRGEEAADYLVTGTYIDRSMSGALGRDPLPREGVCRGVTPGGHYRVQGPRSAHDDLGVLVERPKAGSPYYAIIYTTLTHKDMDDNGVCMQGIGLTRMQAGAYWRQSKHAHFRHDWWDDIDVLRGIANSKKAPNAYD